MESMILGYSLRELTVVDTFGNRLKNFDIERGRTTVISIILVFVITGDTLCPFRRRQLDGGRLGYPGNDLTGIEGEDGWVRIDGVSVEYFWKVRGLQNGFGEVRSERVFIWTINRVNPPQCCEYPKKFLPGISPRLR